jgi:molybdenum cofactor cytidylyltransferase
VSPDPARRTAPPRVAAVILAAGRSRRMGGANKLLERLDGVPMVRRVTETVMDAGLDPVVVVLGHDAGAVRHALDGLPVRFTVNRRYRAGMSSSVAAGIRAVRGRADAALIVLADMPWITAPDMRAIVEAFTAGQRGICAPVVDGRRGNPVLWSDRYFAELEALEGDVGARRLLTKHADDLHEVPVSGDRVFRDIDTLEALDAARAEAG